MLAAPLGAEGISREPELVCPGDGLTGFAAEAPIPLPLACCTGVGTQSEGSKVAGILVWASVFSDMVLL